MLDDRVRRGLHLRQRALEVLRPPYQGSSMSRSASSTVLAGRAEGSKDRYIRTRAAASSSGACVRNHRACRDVMASSRSRCAISSRVTWWARCRGTS